MNIYSLSRKDIEAMDGIMFEELIMSIYEELGNECTKTPASNDYGADIIVETSVGKFSIQCKRQTTNVGIKAVQEVYGSLPKYGAVKGIVITTAGYTANAAELAKVCNIDLIDGNKLWAIITGIQNGDFVKNSKENIREELDKISRMIQTGKESISSFEEKAESIINMITIESEYMKSVSKMTSQKIEMLDGKIDECLNIEIPKGEKGDKGDNGLNGRDGKDCEISENTLLKIDASMYLGILNIILIGLVLWRTGVFA